jgi:hypothetical protein
VIFSVEVVIVFTTSTETERNGTMSAAQNQCRQLGKAIIVILVIALLWVIYGATIDAGAQTMEPTPVCTMTPEGEQCTSSVAMTGTPTATPIVPPPTMTPVTLSPLPVCVLGRCDVRLPIVFK